MTRASRFAIVLCLGTTAAAQTAAQSPAPAPLAQVRQLAYLKASNPEAHDHFGCGGAFDGHAGWGTAVSGDGNTVVVGAPHEAGGGRGVNGNQQDNSLHGAGAAYVYVRNGSTWTQQAYLKASNPQMAAEFGHAVAISADGNTIAVSAFWEASAAKGINGNQDDHSIPNAGAVYVFARRGTTWTQQAYIKASNTGEAAQGDTWGEGDQFGASMALSDDGNTLAVGALSEDGSGFNGDDRDNSFPNAGAVYVFNRTGTNWAQTGYLKPANPDGEGQGAGGAFGDMFGYSVSLSADGRTLAAGAFDEDGSARTINGPYDNRRNAAGAVYVFVKPVNGFWMQQAYVKPNNVDAGDQFGVSVSLSDDGNTLLVGSLDDDCLATGVNPSEPCTDDQAADISTGAAHVFVRSGNTWTQQAFIKPHNTRENDWFASRLALSGDGNTAAIPSPLTDGLDGKTLEAGAVYLFTRSGTTWRQAAYIQGNNTEAYDQFGGSVSLSRDGRTLVATALGEDSTARGVNGNEKDNGADEAGAAYIFQITPRATNTSSF
jgi:hypothetical protein